MGVRSAFFTEINDSRTMVAVSAFFPQYINLLKFFENAVRKRYKSQVITISMPKDEDEPAKKIIEAGKKFSAILKEKSRKFAEAMQDFSFVAAEMIKEKSSEFAAAASKKTAEFSEVASKKTGEFSKIAKEKGTEFVKK